VNLAALAAGEGRRTLIWDLDPQGAATFLFRVRPKVKGGARKLVRGRRDPLSVVKATDVEGLDLLPADFSYRHLDLALDRTKRPRAGLARMLAPVAGDYDLVVLDCPPSISLVSESVFNVSQLLLVPLVPSPLSIRTVDELLAFLADRGIRCRLSSRSCRWSTGAGACTASSPPRCRTRCQLSPTRASRSRAPSS
jgi:cellulose biosynthesis protein BcsQ